eukprot:CAMPEP_0177767472 /NCGR_PEP_ID=MMETSP0491_2-20121128/9132_1 /TAXON_ID=63592 /ORGANISM="Tetraselmis chuii, Strain PLY429" /LENGTH=103 /DNA_ID=CAMNT_0019284067 /DNA_START=134 /DNA_END=445 /DNA_ORIENTATION=-
MARPGLSRWFVPEAVPLGLAVGGALTMMCYTATRSFFTSGDVTLAKTDRENLRTTEEYNVNTIWGVRSHGNSLLRQAGEWWGSTNVLPNNFVQDRFFRDQDSK